MAAYDCSTLEAFPPLLFLFKELIDAILLDVFEVLNHTHLEMCSVSLVEMLKPLAGEIITFVTIFHLTSQQQFASLL